MTRIFRYKKSASLLFLLAYLLIGSGIANALIVCQESKDFSHLEYNPSGKCPNVCLPAEGDHENLGLASLPLPSWSSADDCLDTSVSLFHAPAPEGKNLLTAPVSPNGLAFHFPPTSHLDAIRLTRLNLVAQPPPSQALNSLRTIVLLN